jgi:hypothetical protein
MSSNRKSLPELEEIPQLKTAIKRSSSLYRPDNSIKNKKEQAEGLLHMFGVRESPKENLQNQDNNTLDIMGSNDITVQNLNKAQRNMDAESIEKTIDSKKTKTNRNIDPEEQKLIDTFKNLLLSNKSIM